MLALAAVLALSPLGKIGVNAAQQSKPEGKPVLTIDVDVGDENCNSASFPAGEYHTWTIRSTIPADIADAQSYEILDTLDSRLMPEADSLRVALQYGKDEITQLKQDVHYLFSETVDPEQGTRALRVTLTREGMAYIGKVSGFMESSLELIFRAAIVSGVGESIPNMAQIRYTDPEGKRFFSQSDTAEVHTGGIVLMKTDAVGNPLAGAEFRIARPAQTFGGDMLMLEEEVVPVAYQSFYGTRDLSAGKISAVVTDEDGIAVLYGLAYGTYYIVETKAPEGYNLLTQPIAVIIDEESHLTAADGWQDAEGRTVDHTIRVVNTKFVLPDTGGWGAEIYVITGAWIMAAAVILLLTHIRWHRFG